MQYCEFVGNKCKNCQYEISLPSNITIQQNIICKHSCPNYRNKNHLMPLLYTRDGNPAFLGNTFHNQACFFIGCGPSLLQQDLSLLSSKGILSFAVNNVAASLVKPNLWCSVDDPKHFHSSIWEDPTIMKFVPQNNSGKHYLTWEKKNAMCPARHTPNTFLYNLQDKARFDHNTFLTEKTVCWGSDKGIRDSLGLKGGRSVMLASFKIMYFLGFKRIYLLGCDFDMQHDEKKNGKGLTYAFQQYKKIGGCATNNACYSIISKRLKAIKPLLEKNNCKVYNCTSAPNFTPFPVMDFKEAIALETVKFNHPVHTKNMYG